MPMITDIALIGLGYIGKIHLKLLKENPNWNLIGVYDIDLELTKNLSSQYGVRAFGSLEETISNCDVLDIATPSNTHFETAKKSDHQRQTCFYLKKPVTSYLKEAKRITESH